jgi:hypothetical protein
VVLLAEQEWTERERAHQARVEPWVAAHLQRRRCGQAHPVDDFLFDYYPYSAAKLLAWHPGHDVVLAGDAAERFLTDRHYRRGAGGVHVDLALAAAKAARIGVALEILEGVASRPPSHGCFGMHEWAMVYGQDRSERRHPETPLRLSPAAVRSTVAEVGLRCTHFDAYRFFTVEALPLSQLTPTREKQAQLEQSGCIHANMDLYKYAMWCAPYLPSEIGADCFELARRARDVDMRASPYDLSGLGYEPIRVESSDGRREYVSQQRSIAEEAAPLRSRLIEAMRTVASLVLADCESEAGA